MMALQRCNRCANIAGAARLRSIDALYLMAVAQRACR